MALNFPNWDEEMSSQQSPSSTSGSDSLDILTADEYVFVENAHDGSGGFRDGKYITPHKREAFYEDRRRYSHYTNFVRPVVRAMLEPVFSNEVNREYGNNKIFEKFVDDVDYNGLSLQKFTSMVAKYVRLHSVAFIIMDNFRVDAQDFSVQNAIEMNVHPYIYMKKAYQVESYILDTFGALQEIIFIDDMVTIKTKDGKENVQTYVRWTATAWQRLKKDESEFDMHNDNGPQWVVMESREHGLGEMPVKAVYENPREDLSTLLTHSNLYSLSRLGCTIYNQDSERRELQRSQSFAILCIQEEGDQSAGKNIGSTNYLKVQFDASNMPTFISPDPGTLDVLQKQRDENKKDLFTLADQLGVIGSDTKEAKSGVALSYEFSAYESTLQKTAEIAINIENVVANLFMKYTQSSFEYVVNYEKDYSVTNDNEKITMYEIALNMPLAKLTKKMIKIDMHTTLFPDTSEEELATLNREIDEQNLQYEQDMMNEQNDANNGENPFA